MGDGDDLGARRQQLLEGFQIERAVVVESQTISARHLPARDGNARAQCWNDAEREHHDLVAFADLEEAPIEAAAKVGDSVAEREKMICSVDGALMNLRTLSRPPS